MIYTKFDEKEKVWSLPDSTEQKTFESFGKLLLNTLSSHGSKVAQINYDTGDQMTYLEMKQSAIRIAQNLQNRGFGPRQPFTFWARNSDYLTAVAFASMFLACPINPLHTSLSKNEIIGILKKVKPTIIFCDVEYFNQIEEALKELTFDVKIFTFGSQFKNSEPIENLLAETGTEDSFIPIDVDAETDVAMIICSSGTTGPSKCVLASYNSFTDFFLESWKIGSDKVCLSFEKMYWTIWQMVVLPCISSGSIYIITSRRYSPALQLDVIKTLKVTHLYNTKGHLEACLKHDQIETADCSSVQRVITYGGKIMQQSLSQISRLFPNANLISQFGLTEIGPVFNHVFDQHGNSLFGNLAEGCTVKIVDENGKRCGPNTRGEICVKTKPKFLGYLHDSNATVNAIDKEGFFLTGDIGHFNENGVLLIDDRKKNIIKNVFYFRGFILPSEIENYLIQYSDIDEICIIGIEILSGLELPAAVIVRHPTSNLTEHQVFQMVADKFDNYAKLRGGVYFVDSFPRTLTGKVVYRNVKEYATKMFKARATDPIIQEFIADIPEEMRNLIFPSV